MRKVFGFETADHGLLEVNANQANIVQEIYRQYLSGKSLGGIADFLFDQSILSPSGKNQWSKSVLDKLLSNPKYMNGIISFEDYFAVQYEKEKRSSMDESTNQRKATQYYSKDVLSGLFICAECGGVYWRITRPSGEVVWRCSNKVKHGKRICQHAPSLNENELKQAVCRMLGISEFDFEAVRENLASILVSADRSLTPDFIQCEYHELCM